MTVVSGRTRVLIMLAMLAVPVSGSVAAQERDSADGEVLTTVYAATEGPKIEGFISARSADRLQVTTVDGSRRVVTVNEDTQIKASGGFLGIGGNKLGMESLLNGLPVTIKTMQSGDVLIASQIDVKNKDLKTAAMIRNGTDQRFSEHQAAIDRNAAATEALRGRMGDIDKYNVKGSTNVYFDSGKWQLTRQAERDLCDTATDAEAMDGALLLVVGYTDSTGSYEVNQTLSEKRAGRVVNYLQQACGWKPYRMLTPTGMAAADPLASNDTAAGKAQNRRVSVNILVSKSIDEL
ncbi:OmpA family protein [Croceicoccus ponticola]|uniref:OmpA family protein n=1 Tax=Croceicoccus ponticola TaxID=2217664 RepID=A0A437GYS5_9SPHN|nr:OmpA family protein [Croceicoccus ponticola]RVQ67834.1 OmpA family protein [Croceicoccus ponticola]